MGAYLVDRGTGKAVRVTVGPRSCRPPSIPVCQQRRGGTPPTEIAIHISNRWWESSSAAA
jgi:hypothetical protein